jgi:hypothetical protein
VQAFAIENVIRTTGHTEANAALKAIEANGARAVTALNAIEKALVQNEQAARRFSVAAPPVTWRNVASGAAQASGSVRDLGDKFRGAGLQVAMATEQMARMGTVGGEGLRQIVVQGGQMAFMFGAGGPLVAAIGVAALAIVNVFQRAREEARKAREAFVAEINAMADAGDALGMTRRLQQIELGRPSAGRGQGGGYAGGLLDLRAQVQALQRQEVALAAEIERRDLRERATNRGEPVIPPEILRLRRIKGELEQLLPRLTELEQQRSRLLDVLNNPPTALRTPTGLPEVTVGGAPAGGGRAGPAGVRGPALFDIGPAQFLDTFAIENAVVGAVAMVNRVREQTAERLAGVPGLNISALLLGVGQGMDAARSVAQAAEDIATQFVGSLKQTMVDGFRAAFSGGNVFDALRSGILGGLGEVFIQAGLHAMKFAALLDWLKGAVAALSGVGTFAAGLAMVALGTGLQALGGGGGGGGGVGSSAAPLGGYRRAASGVGAVSVPLGSSANGSANRRPAQMVAVTGNTFVGAHDPAAQRAVVDLVRNAAARGMRV